MQGTNYKLQISHAYEPPPVLRIDGTPLDCVECHKVLGLTLQSNLKWNIFIEQITSKPSKRLHILRVLKHNGIHVTQISTVYMALVRSVLEYGPPIWHTLIPTFLSDEVEKVQKRAFRIIYPQNHYSEALVLSGFPLLSERRSSLCRTTFKKISQPTSRLNYLVPKVRANVLNYELLNNETFTVPR